MKLKCWQSVILLAVLVWTISVSASGGFLPVPFQGHIPSLAWHTFLGGTTAEQGFGIAVDESGNVYVAGWSDATWGAPVQGYSGGSSDTFIAKLDSSGNLVWSTFLGGNGQDVGHAIAVDKDGNVYVAGYSDAAWGTPVRAYAGDYDAFAARLDNNGNLVWNTFLGSSDSSLNKGDIGHGIAVDGDGNTYVTGYSWNTWGAPVRAMSDYRDGFAAKLDCNGNLAWNTFLGSDGDDFGNGITVDVNGDVFAVGQSCGAWGTPVRAYSGWCDGYAVKLNDSGSVVWNTFLGGAPKDKAAAVAVDLESNLYVVGYSDASWGTPVRAYSAEADAYAASLDSSGSLVWNTFLGGSDNDYGNEITADEQGSIYVMGYSRETWDSPTYPFTAVPNAFAVELDGNGSLRWNTFIGAGASTYGYAIASYGSGNIFLAGTGFASWGLPVRAYTGSGDAFAAKLQVASYKFLYLPLTLSH